MKKCLVVDDTKIIRKIIAKIMSNLGFDVTEAEDGEDALETFFLSPVDVIIMDFDMPVVSGLDVLYKIRNTKAIKQPKIIMLSSMYDEENISQAMAGGADDFIIRPLDSDIIATKLKLLGMENE